jgi:hypothetical protein
VRLLLGLVLLPTLLRAQTLPAPQAALQGVGLWVADAFSVQSPPQIEAWKLAADELLRNEPSLPLERALALSYVRTHPNAAVSAEAVEDLLRHGTKLERFDVHPLPQPALMRSDHLDSVEGKLYALGSTGIERWDGARWTRMPGETIGHSMALAPDGELFASLSMSLHRWNGKEWDRTNPAHHGVWRVRRVGDDIWVLEGQRLWVKRPGKPWKKDRRDDFGRDLFDMDGQPVLRRTDNTLWTKSPRGQWRETLPYLGEVRNMRTFEGRTYAAGASGLYRLDGQEAIKLLDGPVWDVARAGDGLVAGTNDGLIRLKSRPEPAGLQGTAIAALAEAGGELFALARYAQQLPELFRWSSTPRADVPPDWRVRLASWLVPAEKASAAPMDSELSSDGTSIASRGRAVFTRKP